MFQLSTIACLIFAVGVQSAAPKPNTCTVNACEKAVRHNYNKQHGKKPAPAECLHFLASTVTPTPFITTVTDTTTTVTVSTTTTERIIPPQSVVIERQLVERASVTPAGSCPAPATTPNPVPTYASACADAAAFSSACSCVGITKGHTTTLKQCTSTQHVTATSTTTATVVVVPTPSIVPTTSQSSATPTPSGVAGSCGAAAYCGSGTQGLCGAVYDTCSCYAGSSGTTACVADGACTAQCSLDSDCTDSAGGICAQNTCCGYSLCLYPSGCANGQLAKRIFARKLPAPEMWSDGLHGV